MLEHYRDLNGLRLVLLSLPEQVLKVVVAQIDFTLFRYVSQTKVLEKQLHIMKSARILHMSPTGGKMMAMIGYIRVSTIDQNNDLQRNALISASCDRIFEDRMSGKVANQPGLKRALKCINSGDTLVVWKLDRLGRSVKNLIALISELHERGAHFRSLTDSIDTSSAMGRFFPCYVSTGRDGARVNS